jgi:osmoprotectant transport system substrate-binding protein
MRRIIPFVCLVALILSPLLAGKGLAEEREPIVVGSKIDTEGALLGQMLVSLLRSNGLEVVDKTEFGTTPIVRKAIKAGQLDIYPEYTGNGAFFFKSVDSDVWRDADKAYARVRELDAEQNDLIWLQPAPANNTWAIAAKEEVAAEHDLKSLEDFADFANKGGRIKLACCEEFVNREDVLPSFQEAYGFSLREDQLLVFSGCNTAQTEQAAARGTSGVNFAMAFGTDGSLAALDLRVLEDTKNVQPVYQPAPLIRRDVKQRYPQIVPILRPLFRSLDQGALQKLNSSIAVEGRPAEKVAKQYLRKQGLLEDGGSSS